MSRSRTTQTPLCAARLALSALALAAVASIGIVTAVQAEGFGDAEQGIDQKLEGSLAELAAERKRIASEKIPLSRVVSRLEDQVLELRREQARLLKTRDSRTIDLTSLRRQVESLREQEEFVDSRLREFVRDLESRLHISELPSYESLTTAARLAEKSVDLDAEGKRNAQVEVLAAALGRMRLQLGGYSFEGEALGPDGVLTKGRFVALGPTVFYASEDGALSGLVEARLNAADPVVVVLPADRAGDVAAIAAGGDGLLPFDATLGKALKKEKARKSVGQYVADGGAVGTVIIALGAVALLLTAFKAAEILRFPVADADHVDVVLDEIASGSQESAAKRAREVQGVAGEMLVLGVEHAGENRAVLEELLFERILRVRPKLERFLPFLAITAAAAPLLGLLGTVIGMIKTFELITIFGTGDAKSLSSGISEALVTTALGLIVAIPTLILHGALARMAKQKLGLLEQLSAAFINGLGAIRNRREDVNLDG